MGDDRPVRYLDTIDGEPAIIWRASGLGTCDRAIVAAARNHPAAPTPQWMRDVWDEGHEMEDLIAARWAQDSGVEPDPDSGQREIELFVGEAPDGTAVFVRGHIDGTACDGRVLREYKKARDSTWAGFAKAGPEHNANYPWQLAAYMLGTGATAAEFVVGHMVTDEWGVNTITEVEPHAITDPPFTMKQIRDRVMSVEKLIAEGFDAPEVPCDKGTYPCPYYVLHDPDDYVFVLPPDDEASRLISVMSEADVQIKHHRDALVPHEHAKRDAAEMLRKLIAAAGETADTAKKLVVNGIELTRVRSHHPARTTKPYDTDYFKLKG